MEVVQDKLADRLRYLHQRQHTGKCRRCRQNKQDRGEGTNRLNQNGPDVADADTPVHKKADDQCIEYGDNSRLSRGSDTAVDTAKDDHRAEQCKKALF